jgi:DNA ligase-1
VDSRGISLRFPRFLKVRDDKNADEATSAEQVGLARWQRAKADDLPKVSEFYQKQVTAGGKKAAGGENDDFW